MSAKNFRIDSAGDSLPKTLTQLKCEDFFALTSDLFACKACWSCSAYFCRHKVRPGSQRRRFSLGRSSSTGGSTSLCRPSSKSLKTSARSSAEVRALPRGSGCPQNALPRNLSSSRLHQFPSQCSGAETLHSDPGTRKPHAWFLCMLPRTLCRVACAHKPQRSEGFQTHSEPSSSRIPNLSVFTHVDPNQDSRAPKKIQKLFVRECASSGHKDPSSKCSTGV